MSKTKIEDRKTTLKHKDCMFDGKYGLGCISQIVGELDERLTKIEKRRK